MLNGTGLLSLYEVARKFEVPVVTAALSIPVVLFSVFGYDINPAFVLAPLIAFILLSAYDKVSVTFILSGVCGVGSVVVANMVAPDGQIARHFLSLILIMFAPSFLFLGRYLVERAGIQKILTWLSIFSTIFVVAITVRILVLGESVRIYLGSEGYAAMNAEFLGMPVFASFGVLSLADLICLQAIILCGSIFSDLSRSSVRWIFVVALSCSAFLVLGSDSRSTQVLLLLIIGAIGLYTWRNPLMWRWASIAIAAIVIAVVVTYMRGMNENRMVESIKSIAATEIHHDKGSLGESLESLTRKADTFATGRVELAIEGFKETIKSPLIGNGFAAFGRYSEVENPKTLAANTSTHVYYLTLIWKGGLLFLIPFIAMLLMNFRDAWDARSRIATSPEGFFAWSAVLLAFGPMAFAWDILIVPSAGALAFFLFGLLSGYSKRSLAQ